LSGAWYGNDTVWRMVMDINKIISFGSLDGNILSTYTQRKLNNNNQMQLSLVRHEGPL